MLKTLVTLITAVAVSAAPFVAIAAGAGSKDIIVKVDRDGNTFTVAAEFTVAADLDETWEVLVDFDKMAQILSNVDASQVVNRSGNRFEVVQKSHGQAGPIRVNLDSTRAVELTPKSEIKSKLLKGDLKSSDFVTRVAPDGAVTRVTVSGKFVAGGLSAAAITPEAVQAQTTRQYQELRDEILRRKAKEPTPPCLLAKNCSQTTSG
jgi:carbon monoxide dehydrogenase subunit G